MKNLSEDTSALWNPLNLTLSTLKLLQALLRMRLL